MNYEKHYRMLCETRQQLNRQKLPASHPDYVYYELHHIVPKHEGGNNEEQSLVLLTPREHFIAHWLFAKWKRTYKAWAALAMFCMRGSAKARILTSKQYEIAKLASRAKKGYKHTEAAKAKISAASRARQSKPWSEETRAKMMALNRKGNTGKKFSEATKQKMSESNKGKVLTEATKAKISEAGKKVSRAARLRQMLKRNKLSKREQFAQEYFALMAGFACELPKGGAP